MIFSMVYDLLKPHKTLIQAAFVILVKHIALAMLTFYVAEKIERGTMVLSKKVTGFSRLKYSVPQQSQIYIVGKLDPVPNTETTTCKPYYNKVPPRRKNRTGEKRWVLN